MNSAKKDAFVAANENSADVLKPFVGGQDLRRWYHEDSDAWLILFPNGVTRAACGATDERVAWDWLMRTYPPIASHLEPFAVKGRRRLDKGQFWWELRACDYYDAFEQPKIMYPDIAKGNRFHLDSGGLYASNTTYFLPVGDWYLLGVLNSKAAWFALAGISIPFGERAGEFRYRLFSQYVGKLPIPNASDVDRAAIGALAERCNSIAPTLHALQDHVRRRLAVTFGVGANGEQLGALNQKAQAWWTLSVSELGAALKASFKLQSSPFRDPRTADEWEPYLGEKRSEVERIGAQLADAEAEINERVFRLFSLTPEETALLLREVEHSR